MFKIPKKSLQLLVGLSLLLTSFNTIVNASPFNYEQVIATGSGDMTVDDNTLIFTFGQAFTSPVIVLEPVEESPRYTLNVSKQGTGKGNITGDGIDCGSLCAKEYKNDTQVILTATPLENSRFIGWGGACSGTAMTCKVVMDSAKNVIATFTKSSCQIIPSTNADNVPITLELEAICDGNVEQYQYEWKVSDGQTASGANVSFILTENSFTGNGCHTVTVTLSVTDNDSLIDQIEQIVSVKNWACIQFEGLETSYNVGDTVLIDLVENLQVKSRFERVDLWVAIQIPSGEWLYRTPYPLIPFTPEPQPFKEALQNAETVTRLLDFEVIPGLGGTYTFYGLYVKEGENLMEYLANLEAIQRSNLAVQVTTLANE